MENMFKMLDKIDDTSLRFDMFKEIIEGFDFNFKRIIVRQYIQHEKNKIANYLADKNKFINSHDIESASRCKTELKKINRYIQFLKNSSVYEEKRHINDNAINSVGSSFSLPIERIEFFDKFCNTNISLYLRQLDKEEISLSVLETMKEECLASQELLRNQYKKARKSQDYNLLREVSFNRHTKSLLLNFINRSISSCNYQLKQDQKHEETYEEVFGKERIFTKDQIEVIESIVNASEFKIKSPIDLIVALKAVIHNYPFSEICESVWSVLEIISEINMEKDLKELYYLSLIDTLKWAKKNQYIKKDLSESEKLERREITEMIKMLENDILILDQSFFDEEEYFDYQVMEYCMDHFIPYYYLKKILESKPSLASLEKDGQAVIISVLERYIESQKIELRNQKKDYIPKEYYKNFYELLLMVRKEPLSLELQEDISELSKEFEAYLKYSGYKSENKNTALLLFKDLLDPVKKDVYSDISVSDITKNLKEYTHYLTNSKSRVLFDQDYFSRLRERIQNYQEKFYDQYETYPNDSLVCQELGIPMYDFMNAFYNCSTVSFLDNHIAYSLLHDGKGSSYLRMHVFDLSAYIHEGDLLEKYLIEHADTKFRNRTLYKEGTRVPSLTCQIKLFPNGTIGDLKIYPSNVNIQKQYTSLDGYRNDPVLKSYVASHKKLGLEADNLFQLEENLKEFFLDEVVHACERSLVPIILCGKKYPDEKTLMYIQSDLGPLFSKMDKAQFQFYSDILRDSLDKDHYVNSGFDTGNYNFKLDSASSYVDVCNQRMLLAYEKICKYEDVKQQWKDYSDSVVSEMNVRIRYIEEQHVKSKKIGKRA